MKNGEGQMAVVMDEVRKLDAHGRVTLLELLVSLIEDSGEAPPDWHRPLVKEALEAYRANPEAVHSLDKVFHELDGMLTSLRDR